MLLLQGLLCLLVRPANRLASGVAAARRVSELLHQAEATQNAARGQQFEGKKQAGEGGTSDALVPVIQWVEVPPPALLSATTAFLEKRDAHDAEAENVSDSQAVICTIEANFEAGKCKLFF